MPRMLSALLTVAALAVLQPVSAQAREVATNAAGDVAIADYSFGYVPEGEGRFVFRLGDDLAPERGFGRNGFRVEPGGSGDDRDRAVALADDGTVLIAGSGARGGQDAPYVRRLLADGRPDPAFGSGGVREFPADGRLFEVTDLRIRPQGLLVAGAFRAPTSFEGTISRPAIFALRPDGSLDEDFGGGDGLTELAHESGRPDASAGSIGVLEDGRLLIGGDGQVARLQPDGDLDPSFAGDGILKLDGPRREIAPSGTKVLLARGLGTDGIEVERRTEDGELDPSWGGDGRVTERLGAQEADEEGNGEVRVGVGDLLARPGGGAVVGLWRARELCDDYSLPSGAPVTFAPDGEFIAEGSNLGAGVSALAERPGGGWVAYGFFPSEGTGCLPGPDIAVRVASYDAEVDQVAEHATTPIFVAPDVRFLSGPSQNASTVSGPSARFELQKVGREFDKGDVVLECALGAAPFGPCPADGRYENLPEGVTVLRARALGIHGAASPIGTYEWVVNHRAPVTSFSAAPPALTRETSARVAFAADEPSTYQCRIDGAEAVPCDSGVVELSGLADGFHEVVVRARDVLGAFETEVKRVAWTVDTRGPAVFFTAFPPAETRLADAAFEFGSGEPGSRLECALDGGAFAACASPLRLERLAQGEHRFAVRAIDPAGNVGIERAHVWRVRTPDGTTPPGPIVEPPGPIVEPPARARLTLGKVRVTRDGRYRLRLRATRTGRARIRATLVAGRRRILAASKTVRLRAGQTRTITIRLNSRARRALRTARKPRVRFSADLAGAQGKRTIPVRRR